MTVNLTLGEELLLLATDDDRGTVLGSARQALDYALAGAALMDLSLRGNLVTEGKNLAVADDLPTGDGILDEALARIRASARPRSARHWVAYLRIQQLRRRLQERLAARGVLRLEEDRVLRLFPRRRYPVQDPGPGKEVRARVRKAVVEDANPDQRTAVLISLGQACGVIERLFSRDERRAAQDRIKAISKGEEMGGAVAATVAATNAALMAAITASIASSSSGS